VLLVVRQFGVFPACFRPTFKSARWCLLGLCFSLGLFVPAVAATTGTTAQNAPIASLEPGPTTAIADFDGDHRLDLATVERGGQIGSVSTTYSIKLQLTASGQEAIRLLAPPGGLAIEARDVNGDSAVDLIVTTARFRHPVAVFLNDGHGGFSRAEPSQFPGAFSDSQGNWRSSSTPAPEAVGVPPESPLGISTDEAKLPDVRGPTDFIPALGSGFILHSFLLPLAGRAPPSDVSYQ
jgi:hypothetical protein